MAEKGWTTLKVVNWTTEYLRQHGIETPRLDAEVLLAHLFGLNRTGIYLHHDRLLTEDERKIYREMVQRRRDHEPVSYIVGHREFWSLTFKVTPDCLIPRPETEHLVATTLKICEQLDAPVRILEIGTGCGAVVICLARELRGARLVATDISDQALSIAGENARLHGVEGQIAFVHSDLFPEGETGFEIIVSNPPYVPTEEIFGLAPEVRDYEPFTALDGGEDGLHFFRALADRARCYLVKGGWLVMEMGINQGSPVRAILQEHGYTNFESVRDHSGLERVMKAQIV